jgi:ubiquitin-conjugating enzyme E2 variant
LPVGLPENHGRRERGGYNRRTTVIAAYSSRFRRVEIGALWLFAALFAALAVRGWLSPFEPSAAEIALVLLAGAVLADLLSGLVHWAADTWGDQTWPIVGPTLIRSFREHHVDEQAITRHGFVEANGATALVLLPALLLMHVLLPAGSASWTRLHLVASLFGLSLTFVVLMTNQIHKWSHLDRPPRAVRVLQRLRLILTAAHHQGHHTGRHTSRYCITTGWLNPLLDRWQLFRRFERLIQSVSPVQPREDDLKLLEMAGRSRPLSADEVS